VPRVEFEPAITVLERVNTVHALGRAATGIGTFYWKLLTTDVLADNDKSVINFSAKSWLQERQECYIILGVFQHSNL
jgi:hypothetical protein